MTETTEPGDNQIKDWAESLSEMDDQIGTLQGGKRDLYASIRESHGKKVADALKMAVRLSRMDSDEIEARDQRDTEAERMLAIIQSRAPRATRVASRMPEQKALEHKPQQPIAKPKSEVLPPPNGKSPAPNAFAMLEVKR